MELRRGFPGPRQTGSDCLQKDTEPKRQADELLLILVLFLVVFGLIILYSTSAYNGRVKFDDPAYYFKKQLFATALGLLGMYISSCVDYHWLAKYAPWGYLASLLLSLAVLFFGDEYNGSKRWLSIGPLSFQPAEFAKVAVILLLAYVISNSKSKKNGLLSMGKIMLLNFPSYCRAGRHKQFKYGYYYTGNSRNFNFCVQSQVSAFYMDRRAGDCICGNFSQHGELPPGAAGYLERS